jgi:hypothetical protein
MSSLPGLLAWWWWGLPGAGLLAAWPQTELGCFLIADAGFPCGPWLLVPWSKRNNGDLDARTLQFNKVLCGQRVVIEQLLEIMKSKWQILCPVRQFATFIVLSR